MRITPVISNIFYAEKNYKNNLTDYSQYRYPVRDSISFSSKFTPINSHDKFRELMVKFKVHCLYCNKQMTYDDKMLSTWKKEGVLSAPIRDFVNKIAPYKSGLMDTEGAIFSIIEHLSKKNPDAKLNYVIKLLLSQAQKNLLNQQKPILKEIVSTANNLPTEYSDKVKKLIHKNKCRMLNIPYIDEFSTKEFSYKMKKIIKTLPNDKNTYKLKRLNLALNSTDLKYKDLEISTKTIERIEKAIGFNINSFPFKLSKNVRNSRSKILNLLIHNIKKRAIETKNKELIKLCKENEKRLKGLPATSKFSNKALIYDLSEALENCPNKKIKAEIFKLANNLPTSSDSVHAFIAKHSEASSTKIAYNLLSPSTVTIEHMHPSSEKGIDKVTNWAGAHKRCNNVRQSKDMNNYYKLFDPKNAQSYWDDIMQLANKGYFSFNEVIEMLKIFQKESKIKIQSNKKLIYRPDY